MRHFHRTIAAAAALASAPALAMNLSPQGLGQVLLYPYYTVNQNQDTYFSVTNYDAAPQVIKVRFLEGRAGRPALDLDVVLGGHDTWTAAISITAAGGAKAVTFDHTCTRPAIPAEGIAFTSSGYDGSSTIPADDGPHDIGRTREGFAEVIGGARLFDATLSGPPPLAFDCATVFDQITTPSVFLAPPGELAGSAAIIDVGAGHYYPYGANAIAHFTELPIYSTDWGPLVPSLEDANSINPSNGDTRPLAYVFGGSAGINYEGQPQALTYDSGADAVSAILMADSIQNDFLLDPTLGATTDWVLTFPTRRFYVDPIYPDFASRAINAMMFDPPYAIFAYDREGTAVAASANGSIHTDVGVISFGSATANDSVSSVFGSALVTDISVAATTGMVRLEVGGDHSVPGAGDSYFQLGTANGPSIYGVPVIGFMAYNIVNANAQPGLLANYGATFEHRRTACFNQAFLNAFICQY